VECACWREVALDQECHGKTAVWWALCKRMGSCENLYFWDVLPKRDENADDESVILDLRGRYRYRDLSADLHNPLCSNCFCVCAAVCSHEHVSGYWNKCKTTSRKWSRTMLVLFLAGEKQVAINKMSNFNGGTPHNFNCQNCKPNKISVKFLNKF